MKTLVAVQLKHLHELRDRENLFFTGSEGTGQVEEIMKASSGFTLLEDGVVLGCCGVIRMWNGVGTIWLFCSESLKARPRLLLETARSVMSLLMANRFHRIEVYMDERLPRHIRFIEALGFTFEGRMVKHTVDQRDHLLYARTN